MLKLLSLFLSLSLIIFFGCSSSQETVKETEEEVYVFDEVPPETFDDNEYVEPVFIAKTIKYFVQIGAFTSEDKAETFVTESKKLISYNLEVKYNPDVELFVVHLPPFDTRADAEKVRNSLWKIKKFADAFILTIEF